MQGQEVAEPSFGGGAGKPCFNSRHNGPAGVTCCGSRTHRITKAWLSLCCLSNCAGAVGFRPWLKPDPEAMIPPPQGSRGGQLASVGWNPLRGCHRPRSLQVCSPESYPLGTVGHRRRPAPATQIVRLCRDATNMLAQPTNFGDLGVLPLIPLLAPAGVIPVVIARGLHKCRYSCHCCQGSAQPCHLPGALHRELVSTSSIAESKGGSFFSSRDLENQANKRETASR